MKNFRFIYFVFIIMAFSCTSDSPADFEIPTNKIYLKWNKAYEAEKKEDVQIGLEWMYSILGAKKITDIIWQNDLLEIDILKMGFTKEALEGLMELHDVIKLSDEYETNNSIDLGRYVTLLIGTSEHYFKIVGIPNKLSRIQEKYNIRDDLGYINNSSVSNVHRLISFSTYNYFDQVFIAKEIDSISNEILEFETIEVMANGQLKFGIYDNNGNRKNSTNPVVTNAGKPGKCMWCHESGVQRLFNKQEDFPNFLTHLQLQDSLLKFNDLIKKDRISLSVGIDFTILQDHTQMELLYISFMEPSVNRLSREWNMSIVEVENRLKSLQTHEHVEFPMLGNLYDRNEVEIFAPFKGLPVSSSVREKSEIEVNYIN